MSATPTFFRSNKPRVSKLSQDGIQEFLRNVVLIGNVGGQSRFALF